MLKHVKRKRTAPKLIYKLLDIAEQRVATDGLNEKGKWSIVKVLSAFLMNKSTVDLESGSSSFAVIRSSSLLSHVR